MSVVTGVKCDICNELAPDGATRQDMMAIAKTAKAKNWYPIPWHTGAGKDICGDCWEDGYRWADTR